jgi:hypothetical protein
MTKILLAAAAFSIPMLVTSANSAQACSMSPLGASTTVITAVTQFIRRTAEPMDEASRIDVRGLEARVQFVSQTGQCSVARYYVDIAADCKTSVAILDGEPESCNQSR